jgi:predicted transcriptional regulator
MMDTHTPDTVTLKLSPELAKRLEEMAREQQRPLIDIAQETFENAVLNTDLDNEEDYEDSDEEILAGLRESLEDMKAGRMRPIEELFDEIREARKHDR